MGSAAVPSLALPIVHLRRARMSCPRGVVGEYPLLLNRLALCCALLMALLAVSPVARAQQAITIASAEWSGAPRETFGPLLDEPMRDTVGKTLTGKQIAELIA